MTPANIVRPPDGDADRARAEAGKLTAEAERRRAKRERKGRVGPSAAASGSQDGSRPAARRYAPPLAFVHIPKTAGGTVKGMFFRAYSKAATRKAGNYFGSPIGRTGKKLQRQNWSIWVRNGGRVAYGHVPYGLLREHLPADTRYATFLREPVSRVRSHYNRHLRAQRPMPSHGAGGELRKFNSIEQGLVEVGEPRLNNLMTRLLCGDLSPDGKLPASALDDAKAILRGFFFVGLTERFDESIALLQRRLGLEAVPCGPRQRVNRDGSSEELTDRDRALIEEHNQLDLELYAFAVELFEDAMARDGEDIAGEVETIRGLNAAADEEAQRATQEACEWIERELPVGIPRSVAELGVAAEAAGIEKRIFDSAKGLLDLEKRPGPDGPSWVRSPVTLEYVREWLERELPIGTTRSTNELFTAAAQSGIERRKLGRAAQLLGADEVTCPDGSHGWSRPGADR